MLDGNRLALTVVIVGDAPHPDAAGPHLLARHVLVLFDPLQLHDVLPNGLAE